MNTKSLINRIIPIVPPWGLIGAALILLPILGFVTYEDIHRQNAASRRQLLEKGAALIRSFEAGTRAGMVMSQWGARHLQRLLVETASQPDISYLMVTDATGRILAHSSADKINQHHGRKLDLTLVADTAAEIYRILDKRADTPRVFEVYRKFSPSLPSKRKMGQHHRKMHPYLEGQDTHPMRPRRFGPHWGDFGENDPGELIIFVGLDMTEVDQALAADTRHSLFMAVILLLVGFAGVTLLLMTYNYRTARASLKRITSFSDSLVDNLPVGLISLGADKRIVTVNPAAVRILGLAEKQLVGLPAADTLPLQLAEVLNDLDAADRGIEKEVKCRLENAATIAIGLNASDWRDREGVRMGTIVLIRDLSEIRALRKEVARSQRLASLGSLAAGVAHEIRNPLSSIKGFATYFKERTRENSADHETAAVMISEVERLNRVVGQLLELARPVEILKKPIAVDSFLDQSVTLIRTRAAEKQIAVEVGVSDPELTITADSDRIRQVLLNLYLNAIDAMEAGQGRLAVSARPSVKEPGILIEIADNGIGIENENLSQLFDPYFTGKSTGTGLGLAIVHNIMEAHAGSVSVASTPDKGSTFTLFFPEGEKGEIHD